MILLKERTIIFIGGCAHQAVYADTLRVLVTAVHELASKYGGKDRMNAMIEQHGT
jgi:hypothetical protein